HEDRLGWERRLTCHSFRHAFGTHLYENGTDLLTIKALMGHKSLHSTTIYVHLSGTAIRQAVSPFDHLAGVCHE
ncbi:MAG: tyrosine-type recombinase/integrase, partial [Acetivibrio ethanolgignens]